MASSVTPTINVRKRNWKRGMPQLSRPQPRRRRRPPEEALDNQQPDHKTIWRDVEPAASIHPHIIPRRWQPGKRFAGHDAPDARDSVAAIALHRGVAGLAAIIPDSGCQSHGGAAQ
jgi:hypothetical protein